MMESDKKRVVFGPYEADLQTQELWKHGRRLKLGGQPFGILAMLLERPGELVTRDSLRARLWAADTFVDFNQGLNAAVNKLRDCLSDSADDPKYIETLPRRGYRFIGAASERLITPHPAVAIAHSDAPGPPSTAASELAPRLAAGAAGLSRTRPDFLENSEWSKPVPVGRVAISYVWLALATAAVFLAATTYWLFAPRHTSTKAFVEGPVFLGGNPLPASDPAFSPDGNRIAFRQIPSPAHAPGIYVFTVAGERQVQLTENETDCCPVWSPDGEMLAFTRTDGDVLSVYEVPAQGGAPRKLYATRQRHPHGDLAWSADGKFLAFSGDAQNGGSRILALSINDKQTRALTAPSKDEVDWGPSYSPDGSRLSFVRSKSTGDSNELFTAPALGTGKDGAEQQLTADNSRHLGPPAWTPDSKTIVYASSLHAESRLWKIAVQGGTPEPILSAGDPSWHPTIPRQGPGLAYQHILGASSIWRLDTTREREHDASMVVISSNGRNEGPELSPNGKKLAFMSDRSGTTEIWISDADGSYPMQLTKLSGCGTPRWSPDSRVIAFDSVHDGRPSIYVVDLNGSEPTEMVADSSENMVPSWSRDGRWIYFASNRSGRDQVWKIPVTGGAPMQVTREGGFAGTESMDGTYLYYAKTREARPEIWQISTKGGKESLLSPLIRPGIWANWAVAGGGIYFVDQEEGHHPQLEYFDLSTQQARVMLSLNSESFWLSASGDGESLWYGQSAHNESNIMVEPNFH